MAIMATAKAMVCANRYATVLILLIVSGTEANGSLKVGLIDTRQSLVELPCLRHDCVILDQNGGNRKRAQHDCDDSERLVRILHLGIAWIVDAHGRMVTYGRAK